MSTRRWLDLLTGGREHNPADPLLAAAIDRADTRTRTLLSTMDRSPGRTALWPDLAGPEVQRTTAALARLRALALTLRTKGSQLEHDPGLLDLVTDALAWIHRNRYREDMDEVGNWWEWEIGVPNLLLDTIALAGVPQPGLLRAVRRFVPDPTRRTTNPSEEETGANRADKAYIHLRRGLLSDYAKPVEEARRALEQVFEYVTNGDGFYRDGSFVQHLRHAYTGTYGVVLLGSVARTLAVLGDEVSEVVQRWVFDSFEPITFRSQVMSFVRGRSITRNTDDHAWARQLVSALTLLPGKRIGSYVRDLTQSGVYERTAGVAELVALRKAITDAPTRGPVISHHTFAGMDRAVHHRGGWVFAISARSNRINGYESGNGENLRGWYTGEGRTYLYNADLTHYSGDFWASVDPYRLPGTTTATQATHPRTPADSLWFGGFRGPDSWVGGVTRDRDTGTFGMRFTAGPDQLDDGRPGAPNSLRGTKSWFMFDDEIVALGAGVTSEDGEILTTVENRRTTSAFTTGPGWAHLPGVGGYLLTAPVRIETGKFAQLWFDHGRNPNNAAYEYVLLPGLSATETAARAANPASVVLHNTDEIQAVRHGDTLAVNFYAAGGVEDLRCAQPAAVVLDPRGLAISDPTQAQRSLVLDVLLTGLRVTAADPGVVVTALPKGLRVTVRPRAGQTYRVLFGQ